MTIDDGEWHSVKWTRSNTIAQLLVDGTLVGNSNMVDCMLNTSPPYYYGGTNPADHRKVLESIVSPKYIN